MPLTTRRPLACAPWLRTPDARLGCTALAALLSASSCVRARLCTSSTRRLPAAGCTCTTGCCCCSHRSPPCWASSHSPSSLTATSVAWAAMARTSSTRPRSGRSPYYCHGCTLLYLLWLASHTHSPENVHLDCNETIPSPDVNPFADVSRSLSLAQPIPCLPLALPDPEPEPSPGPGPDPDIEPEQVGSFRWSWNLGTTVLTLALTAVSSALLRYTPQADRSLEECDAAIAQCDKLVAMCAEMNGLGLPAVHAR
jgi:hypothetical protein